MKLNYFPDTNSLYIDLSHRPSVESQEVSEGVVLDYDGDGNLVGIDIDHASRKLDLRGTGHKPHSAESKSVAFISTINSVKERGSHGALRSQSSTAVFLPSSFLLLTSYFLLPALLVRRARRPGADTKRS